MKVEVVKYNPEWLELFHSEKLKLNQALAKLVKNIYHIGSTAVPGLAAKPIVDIMIEVSSFDALERLTPVMNALGYEAKGEFGIPGRRYFRKGGTNRTHQIHVFKINDVNLKRHLAFRDYLISHPNIMQEYANLKTQLAIRFYNDIKSYCEGKNQFIKHYESQAIAWSNEQHKHHQSNKLS